MTTLRRYAVAANLAAAVALFPIALAAQRPAAPPPTRPAGRLSFEVSFPPGAHSGPVTGRVFVMISRTNDREPRLQIGRNGAPFFGRDVERPQARTAGDHRRHGPRESDLEPRGDSARRVLRAGDGQRLLRVQARRRPRAVDARRPVGRPALESIAGESLQRRPENHRRRARRAAAGRQADHAADHPAGRGAARHCATSSGSSSRARCSRSSGDGRSTWAPSCCCRATTTARRSVIR